jgi:Gas vesicle synthesis protein GvpL/GvpF
MAERLAYVYGIVPTGLALAGAPRGLDDAPLSIEREGEVAALVSWLDASAYAPETIEGLVGDVAWVGPRAVAHDAVLTWASDAGAVIPLPMFTLFTDVAGVRGMLRARASALQATLTRVAPAQEFAVRVFRIDSELSTRLGELSPAIAQLEEAARAATPGQRYLLERKADAERRSELRRIGTEVGREVYQSLQALSVETAREALPTSNGEGSAGIAVLNAFFLVRRDAVDQFRSGLTALAHRFEPRGFRFEFTGPWPPYHFVRDRA